MSRFVELAAAAAIGFALSAAPVAARDPEQPVIGQTPDAKDVALTPVEDLNLTKDEIPAVLLAAAADPYASAGLRKCADIAAAIAPLDAALGPDMDVAEVDGERVSAGEMAKSVIASFIPLRGVIRELTGAADHQREFQAAIYAGAVRRGFLKGLGQQMKCAYPARPAFARVVAPANSAAKPRKAGKNTAEPTRFVSEPVVQGTPASRAR